VKTSEVLNKAADLIEERGWVRGSAGWPGMGPGLCLEGGMMAACGETFTSVNLFEFWACPAYRAVQEHLDLTPGEGADHQPLSPPYRWNDAPTRTEAEVIETLRAAAVIEHAREVAAERESVAAR
jgi:hypothetical protein